jgi:sugar phosphate isomerase/epimerase
MGDATERARFLTQVEKACRIGRKLRDLKIRQYGIVRIDSAAGAADWAKDPKANTRRIAETFREAATIAESFGERLAAEGEICWAGMHSWRHNVQLLEMVDRPQTVGFQADMAHTMLFTMGFNSPEDRLLPDDFEWSQSARLAEAYAKMAAALRPWTNDFHVAQNDGTVKGAGSHDKTGRHCQPNDPNGKLDIVRDAGAWLRGADGEPTRAVRHICWDGCMFPNSVMLDPKTWEDVLRVMIAVRRAHGWN